MRYKQLLIAAIFLISIVACNNNEDIKTNNTKSYSGHKVTVLEAINGNTYTYLRLNENGNEHWAAISKRETEVGEVLYYNDALEMHNFKSKELDKNFETILFISKVYNKPIPKGGSVSSKVVGGKHKTSKTDVSVKPATGGITIAELFANLKKYKGETVIVKGKVTKFNSMIMNKNWVHIQDGTENNGKYDLTITTNETVSVGDVVAFKGTIELEKDFGAGYFYEVIMESATTLK